LGSLMILKKGVNLLASLTNTHTHTHTHTLSLSLSHTHTQVPCGEEAAEGVVPLTSVWATDSVIVGVTASYLPPGVFSIECVLFYVVGIECVFYYVIVVTSTVTVKIVR
jgi:hypothetical protein